MGDFIAENVVCFVLFLGLSLGLFFCLCSLHKRDDDEKKAKAERLKREADDAVERVKDKQRGDKSSLTPYKITGMDSHASMSYGGSPINRVLIRYSDKEMRDFADFTERHKRMEQEEKRKKDEMKRKIDLEDAIEFYEQQVYGQQKRARRDDNDLLYTAGAFAFMNHHASMANESSSSGSSHSPSRCSRDDDSSSSSCSSSSSDSGSSSWGDD